MAAYPLKLSTVKGQKRLMILNLMYSSTDKSLTMADMHTEENRGHLQWLWSKDFCSAESVHFDNFVRLVYTIQPKGIIAVQGAPAELEKLRALELEKEAC